MPRVCSCVVMNESKVANLGFSYKEFPTVDQTDLFESICSRFLQNNPNSHIVVHCTHGFNRTGFMICSYLVKQEDWCIEAALAAFEKSRPPGIYKQDYIDELFTRYGDIEDRILAPPKPDWTNEDLEYNDDEQVSNHIASTSGRGGGGPCGDPVLESINGISFSLPAERIKELQRICSHMCKFNRKGFPGSQPVSLSHENLHFLQKEEYMVSWKADGARYMMLILGPDDMFFFDRDYRVAQVFNLQFFRKNSTEFIGDTMLDGEMVIDNFQGENWPRFLIYDVVYCDGQDVSELNFRERLNVIFKNIILPRENAKRSGRIDRTKEPIGIRMKDFFELKDTHKFFATKFQKALAHEIDGLIFQPVKMGYIAGRCDEVLKWKPSTHNSVDFRLKITKETRPGMVEPYIGQLFVGNQDFSFANIKVTKELRNLNNKIIECRFNMQKRQWEFMRERTDKSYPNAYKTAVNVCESIFHPITKDYLLHYISVNAHR